MEAQLYYFKDNGKFYCESVLTLIKEEECGKYYNIGDRIRLLSAKEQLPDVTSDWLANNGFIVVMQDDIGWPILVKHLSNNETIPAFKAKYQPGKETNHKITLYSFKKYGKYNIEEHLTLDDNCIRNGVAMVDNIIDKVCSQKKKRGYYYMICAPDDELSGCPHLLLPTYF